MIPVKPNPDVLRRAVQMALACADDVWYRHTLKSDICGCALSDDEKRVLVDGAARIAADMAHRLSVQYGSLSPQKLAEAKGLKIMHTAVELREPYLYIGLYEPSIRTIILNDNAILLVRQFISANGLDDLTPVNDITRIALFHEIFHALEEETPNIYTRSRMLKRKLLGIFPYMRGLAGVSEVGAVHFSKCMAGVSYSPCIYERYLLMALDRLAIDFLLPNV